MRSKTFRWPLVGLAVAGLALAAGFATATDSTNPRSASAHPNIVFVLTDDLAWNLLEYTPHVRQMQRQGATFSNYFVTDSAPART